MGALTVSTVFASLGIRGIAKAREADRLPPTPHERVPDVSDVPIVPTDRKNGGSNRSNAGNDPFQRFHVAAVPIVPTVQDISEEHDAFELLYFGPRISLCFK
ncbi:MAG TPA: hypothetical protein VNM15_05110 [Candidatus Binatia bacterium]|nr:hypothetical protein [Candidatus Binatia bacterium]